MSTLRRRIRNLGRASSAGIGFAALRSAAPARWLLVVADVASADPAAAAEAGADVLLATPDDLPAAVRAAGEHPVGVRLAAATPDAVAAAAAAGADFFLFDDARTPAAALLAGSDDRRADLGRVLELEADPSDERLRSLAALGLDALLAPGARADLTVREQLALRRTADLAGAPLMAAADAAPSAESLEIWRDAGTRLVLVPGDAATVRATADAIGQVPAPRRARDDRSSPLVPALGGHAHDVDETEDPL